MLIGCSQWFITMNVVSSDDRLALIAHAGHDNHTCASRIFLSGRYFLTGSFFVRIENVDVLIRSSETSLCVRLRRLQVFIVIFVMLTEISQIYKFGLHEEECTE